jgi:WD40 repeat protein
MGLCQLAPHLFAIAGSDNTIRIFNDVDQQVQAKLIGHNGSVSILKRTNRHLISGSFDTTIRIWDIEHSVSSIDARGRFVHPVAAQFEDSGAAGDVK